MADVFISYHVKSQEKLVRLIVDLLTDRGVTCWYSGRDVPPGGDFADHVPGEIWSCRVFLLILDKGAMGSDHIRREVGLADETDPLILPFQAEKCELSDWMAYYLKNVQVMNKPFRPVTEDRLLDLADHIAAYLGKPEDGPPVSPPLKFVPYRKILLSVLGVLLVLLLAAVWKQFSRGGDTEPDSSEEITEAEPDASSDTAQQETQLEQEDRDTQTDITDTQLTPPDPGEPIDGVVLMETAASGVDGPASSWTDIRLPTSYVVESQ